ncbi:MAG: GNAT family N-acetyltransferase, partial [Bacillota bacterium]|nr:GNAT family N-acetyltransferase [Bacillota bacterium]
AFQGRGVGHQLLKQAANLSIRRGCQSITIHNPAEGALDFYVRSGFRLYREYDEYVVKVKPYKGPVEHRGLPTYEEICQLPLQLGRYQSQRECYDMLRWEQSPGAVALPGLRTRDFYMNAWLPLAQGNQAFLALRPTIGAQRPRLYLYTPELDSELIGRVLGVVHQQHFTEATLLLERGTGGILKGIPVVEKKAGQKMLIFTPRG